MNFWSIHICALDRECRRVIPGGAPWRLEIHTPWRHLGVAFTPGDRYCRLNEDGTIHTQWISWG